MIVRDGTAARIMVGAGALIAGRETGNRDKDPMERGHGGGMGTGGAGSPLPSMSRVPALGSSVRPHALVCSSLTLAPFGALASRRFTGSLRGESRMMRTPEAIGRVTWQGPTARRRGMSRSLVQTAMAGHCLGDVEPSLNRED